jgi:hypothetical protein
MKNVRKIVDGGDITSGPSDSESDGSDTEGEEV